MEAAPRQRYSTDLTDEQWALIQSLVERERQMDRPTVINLREVVNALLYLNRTGCQWRLLPTNFPNWNTVRYYFDQWALDGTFIRINDALRERVGRELEPSAGMIDSQSVKMSIHGWKCTTDLWRSCTTGLRPRCTMTFRPHCTTVWMMARRSRRYISVV
jgi:transposase